MNKIEDLQDLIDSEDYQNYQSDTLFNLQYHIINDTDIDVDKMIEANKNGEFGVTHQDFIDNWRDYLENSDKIDDEIKENIEKEIDKLEANLVRKNLINNFI